MNALDFYTSFSDKAILIVPIIKHELAQFLQTETQKIKAWVEASDFNAESGSLCLISNEHGQLEKVLLGIKQVDDVNAWALAANRLPPGDYKLSSPLDDTVATYWALAQYQFNRYNKKTKRAGRLVLDESQLTEVTAIAQAIFLVRDLINTPTNAMGPIDLAEAMQTLAVDFKGTFHQISGDELCKNNFPAIHAVGRASAQEPRLLELRWGDSDKPLVSLVGKGVCFDSGGLDIKPANAMSLMKKDMGGAAHVLGLAQLIMSRQLPIQLQVLVPAVENAISGNAYRPGDILNTRKGLTVEIGNTDAEGRLVLADALTLATESKPDLIIDFATLTGAARVAVGTDIAAMFCNDETVSGGLYDASLNAQDPVWRLPLHQAYLELIQPGIADLSNSGKSPYAGAITAALFLQQFIEPEIPWVHFDVMAWNTASKPGKPEGGEALGLRTVYSWLKSRYE